MAMLPRKRPPAQLTLTEEQWAVAVENAADEAYYVFKDSCSTATDVIEYIKVIFQMKYTPERVAAGEIETGRQENVRTQLPPHAFRNLADELHAAAVKYQGTQQLRANLVKVLGHYVQPSHKRFKVTPDNAN